VSSVSNGLYFLTLPLVSVMCFIYTSKGKSKKFGVRVIHPVRVIYRKIRYFLWVQVLPFHSPMLLAVVPKCYQETRSLEQSTGDPVTRCSHYLFITTKYDRLYWFSSPKIKGNSRKQHDNFSNTFLKIHSFRDPTIRRLDTLYSQQALMAPSISCNASSHTVFLTVSLYTIAPDPTINETTGVFLML
jgi:hypothetical protein